MGWAHGFARCTTFDVRVLDQEGVINHVVDLLCEDARHVTEIKHHADVRSLRVSDQISADFRFETVPVAVEMGAFAAVIWHAVPGVGFDPASYRGGQDSSSSKVKQTELMQ